MTKLSNKLEINISPISINKVFQGRRFKTPEYTQWRKDFSWIVKKVHHKCTGLKIDFYIKNFAMSDVDNMVKPFLDALVENKIIDDDRYIKKLILEKFKVDNKEDEKIVVRFINSVDEILNI